MVKTQCGYQSDGKLNQFLNFNGVILRSPLASCCGTPLTFLKLIQKKQGLFTLNSQSFLLKGIYLAVTY